MSTKRKQRTPVCDCNDCGVNVISAGEYYMVDPAIWRRLGLSWGDNLCIGCLESRLGRKLNGIGDFICSPKNPGGFPMSERYLRRFVGDQEYERMSKPRRRP